MPDSQKKDELLEEASQAIRLGHLKEARHYLLGAAIADGTIDLSGLAEFTRVALQETR